MDSQTKRYTQSNSKSKKMFQPVTKLFHNRVQGKQECTTKHDMVTASIMENQRRFPLTFDIPPMYTAFNAVIGYDAEKVDGRQILDGAFDSLTETPKYLRNPQIVINRGPISTIISTQEHIQGRKKQK